MFTKNTISQAGSPSWSADGTQFAFTTQPVRGGHSICPGKALECGDVYVVPVSGGVPARITNDTMNDWFPRWSPDGTKIVFLRDSSQGGCSLTGGGHCRFDVFTMNAVQGSAATDLTNSGASDGLGSWGPA